MNTITITIEITTEDDTEDVCVEIDQEKFLEYEDKSDQVKYIKKITKKQHPDAKNVNFTKKNLKEIYEIIDENDDTSSMLANENLDDYLEH